MSRSKAHITRIPDVLLAIISQYAEPFAYLALVGTCKAIRHLTDRDNIPANHILDVVHILELIFTKRRNVFITGSAGTGKSYLMNMIYDYSLKRKRNVAMTASTGIAAINLINGRTIHSFSGLKKGTIPIDDLKEKLRLNLYKIPKTWVGTDLLLIDEISMVGCRLMQKLDLIARTARESPLALGGIQVVFAGDFLQLPPVADKLPFMSNVWEGLNLTTVMLKYPFRQSQDMNYYRFLQRIRVGEPLDKDIDFIKEKCLQTKLMADVLDAMPIKPTRILSKQAEVLRINNGEFNKLESKIEFTMTPEHQVRERVMVNGKARLISSTRMTVAECLTKLRNTMEHQAPSSISFRDGAQYILTFNFDVKKKHVNGSRCFYQSNPEAGNNMGNIVFKDGTKKRLDQCINDFYYSVGNNIFLVRRQVALRLGYATTVHSSQGLSLDCARINLGSSIFCASQAYTSLSRVRSAEGLYIDDFVEKSIKTNQQAKKYMEKEVNKINPQ